MFVRGRRYRECHHPCLPKTLIVHKVGGCSWLIHAFACSNPSCLCLKGIEDNEHFLLHCPRFATQRRDLLDLVSSLSNGFGIFTDVDQRSIFFLF